MPATKIINPQRTAVLSLDFLTPILEGYASDKFESGDRAAKVIAAARTTECLIGHVVPSFMVNPSLPFGESVDFYPPLRPASGDGMFLKSGVGAFAGSGLEIWLRQSARDTLVLMGVATSGIVLSTVRWGHDMGFHMIVVSDACSDMDPKAHEMLTRETAGGSWIGLWRMAGILTADEVVAQLTG